MQLLAIFWASIGFLVGIASSFFLVPLWQASALRRVSSKSWWLAASVVIVFAVVAVAMYAVNGKPDSIVARSATSSPAHAPSTGSATASSGAGSMQDAVTKLSQRLGKGGGSDADWQLLQQSYEFLGDQEAADLAKQHLLKKGEAAAAPSPKVESVAAVSGELARYQTLVGKNPQDAKSWLAIAELQRSARDFVAARGAYQKVIALKAMTADSWANDADIEASLANSLSAPSARAAIDAALKLDPKHPKALWLAASLALEEKQYAESLSLWMRLRNVLPKNSPDTAVVDANITEARSLSSTSGNPNAISAQNAQRNDQNDDVHLRGTVRLNPALQARFNKNMTLFVYAKTLDGKGAPLAVLRTAVDRWPIAFELTDALAMLPDRRLSQFDEVSVEARLSSTGQALAQSGDLRSARISVATKSQSPVGLTIDSVVQ